MAPRQITYSLTLDSHEPHEFEVIDFEVREALSEGCTVVVRAASASFFDASKLMGKDGHLELAFADEASGAGSRWWNGIITRCSLQLVPNGAKLLEVQIESRLALMAFGRENKIFTKTNTQKIVEELLKKGKIPTDDQKWTLDKDPPECPHVFQRNESDLEFIQRLLSREGIGYAIHNEEKQQQILLFDAASSLPPIPGDDLLLDRDTATTGLDVVYEVREKARVASDALMMRDYDLKLPGNDLDTHAKPVGTGTYETYLHPGGYTDPAVGKRLAQRALDAIRVGTRGISGRSDCARLEPGRHFKIDGHARTAINVEYLVVEVVHRGHRNALNPEGTPEAELGAGAGPVQHAAYECTFSAILADLPFRPALQEPLRRGCEVAFATVPPGEEIHVDEYARVTVRFPWDRSGKTDDTSSAFLRVGQLPLGGSMIFPREKFEVIVDYELADVDRPYVEGHLYNGELVPPYPLPQGATTSSIQTNTTSQGGGANEIRFEDAAGSEEIFLNASRDLTISVDNDAKYTVTKNEKVKVGTNNELLVGTDFGATVTSNRKLQVGAAQKVNVTGDFSESVGTNATITIGAMRKVQCGGDHTETTKGQMSRTVGALQSVTGIKGVGRNVVGNSTVTVGAAWTEVVGRSRSSDVKGSRTETVAALKMVRAKTVSLSCGGNLVLNAAAEMVTVGGSRNDTAEAALAITTGGGLSVKAKSITIEGKDTLVMMLGGCIFKLAKGGKILIKAPTIDLKGAKKLGQVMHGSN